MDYLELELEKWKERKAEAVKAIHHIEALIALEKKGEGGEGVERNPSPPKSLTKAEAREKGIKTTVEKFEEKVGENLMNMSAASQTLSISQSNLATVMELMGVEPIKANQRLYLIRERHVEILMDILVDLKSKHPEWFAQRVKTRLWKTLASRAKFVLKQIASNGSTDGTQIASNS